MILQVSSGGEKEAGGVCGVLGMRRLISSPKHRGCFSITEERFGVFNLFFVFFFVANPRFRPMWWS